MLRRFAPCRLRDLNVGDKFVWRWYDPREQGVVVGEYVCVVKGIEGNYPRVLCCMEIYPDTYSAVTLREEYEMDYRLVKTRLRWHSKEDCLRTILGAMRAWERKRDSKLRAWWRRVLRSWGVVVEGE